MTRARILRIEKLSRYDGEGLRTVIFFKGCPLRCLWCSTPESQAAGTDFGVAMRKCTRCLDCVETCPEDAISHDADRDTFTTDRVRCSDCRQCIDVCIAGARTAYGYTASVEDLLKEVGKDSVFYHHSGGGVTLSGGEPLMQKDFVRDLLQGCHRLGINTAVETSGHVPWENIEAVLPVVDTLFYDLKHMDPAIHRRLCAAGNRLVLANLQKIDRLPRSPDMIIRMPIVPGFNDDDENIRALGRFCRKLKQLNQIQLLPYHRLGIETYRRLCRSTPLQSVAAPEKEAMQHKASLLREMGFTVEIGGY